MLQTKQGRNNKLENSVQTIFKPTIMVISKFPHQSEKPSKPDELGKPCELLDELGKPCELFTPSIMNN